MKQCILLLAMFAGLLLPAQAQDIFNNQEPITWLGLDFSNLKLIKDDEKITDTELQNKYFAGWNELMLQEPKKYDVARATGRVQVENNTTAITKVNAAAKPNFITDDAKAFEHLDEAKIKSIVKKYDLKGLSGIGLVFVVEAMDKSNKEASIWVTFINMQTKEVLLSKPLIGESGGFGFRNYWAGSINKVLKALPDMMRKWKKNK